MTLIQDFLFQIIQENASNQALSWLQQKIGKLKSDFSEKDFLMAFVGTPRFVGKIHLQITDNQLVKLNELRKGFNPSNWTIDQMTRVLLLLHLPSENQENYLKTLNKLFETGEVSELVALYSSLPLLPYPELHIERTSEGIRSNIAPVFEAVALNTPYPAEYLPENAWNQLFMKAIFTEKKIWQIQGVQARANADLVRICSDYAHERWAAGRLITPELWIPVGKFVNELITNDLEKLFSSENIFYPQAAALVCVESENPKAKELLQGKENLVSKIEKGELTWESLSKAWWASKQ